MRADKNWLTISLFVIAIILITISLFHTGEGRYSISHYLYPVGLILFFFALLNTWGNKTWRYYAILLAVLVLLTILPFFLPTEWDLVKIQEKNQIPGHWAEDMTWSIGGILFAGYLAGIIGLFISIRRRK